MKKSIIKSALSLVLSAVMLTPSVSFAETDKNLAYAEFSTPGAAAVNMKVAMASGNVKTAEHEGRVGWALSKNSEAEATINVDLNSSFAYKVSDGSVFEIEVDYYDAGAAVFSLVYSAQDRPNRWAGMQKTSYGAKAAKNKKIKAWRTRTFRIQDARFADNLDDCDFKISANILDSNHDITASTDSGYGKNYSSYYPNRYGRISTIDDIVIGAVRVKKLEEKNPFSGKITTSAYGNVFYDDEDAAFDIALKNNTKQMYDLNARYYAVDTTTNMTVAEKTEKVSIGAEEEKTITSVLDAMPYGVFKYYAEFTADGVKSVFTTDTSRARESKVANKRAGTNVHFDGMDNYRSGVDEQLSLAKRSGYVSVRDSIRWPDNEKAKGQYKLKSTTAAALEGAKKWEIDYMPVHFSHNENVYPDSHPISTDEAWQAYKKYCSWLTKELGTAGYAVESANEWNLTYPNGTGEQYTYMIKALYEGTKEANPNMKVIGIDTGLIDLALVRKWFEAGALEYMDGISYHPYDWMKSFENGNQMTPVAQVRKLMAEFGHPEKEIWCTETGWHQQMDNCFVTDMDKANNLSRALLQNDALKYYDRIYFYEFMNSGMEPSYGESTYGTINSVYDDTPYSALPAYVAAACANWIVGSGDNFVDAADGKEADLTARIYAYRWNRDNSDGKGSQAIGVWTSNDREPYALNLGIDEVTVVDMFGNERTMKAINGVFNFMLTDSPVYLIGDFKKFNSAAPTIDAGEKVAVATVNDTVIANIAIPNSDNMKIEPKNTDFSVSENDGFKNGKAKYVLTTPKAAFYNKCAMFDVTDGDKLVYSGNIKIDNEQTVTIGETHAMSDTSNINRWYLDLKVTNNKNSGPVSGVLKVNAPSEIAKYVGDIQIKDLAPKATYEKRLFMPEIITKEMRDYNVSLRLDNGEYFDDKHTMFFTTVPYAYTKPTIDGKVSDGEYRTDTWFPISPGENNENVELLYGNKIYLGESDLSGKATATYDEENIYFFIEVTDNQFVQKNTGSNIWDGDSIQIGLADQDTASSGSYNELTVALTPDGPQMYRHLSNNSALPTGLVEDKELVIVHEGNKIYYEIKIPWAQCLRDPSKVGPGYIPKFAFLINDDDGLGRNKYMEYSQVLGAIGTYKNVGYFSDMYLADK